MHASKNLCKIAAARVFSEISACIHMSHVTYIRLAVSLVLCVRRMLLQVLSFMVCSMVLSHHAISRRTQLKNGAADGTCAQCHAADSILHHSPDDYAIL